MRQRCCYTLAMPLLSLALALLIQGQDAPPPAKAAAKPPTFAQVATEHFAKWDSDQNGTLSDQEIDVLCVRPTLVGPEAAAVAALKRIVRSGRFAVPPLTLPSLTSPLPKVEAKPDTNPSTEDGDDDRRDAAEAPATQGQPGLRKPNFQASYAACLRRITTAKRELFVDATPDLDACHQGPLGDCYLVASVGALVHRNPDDLKKLIAQLPDGRLHVTFGDGRSATFAPLTDAELALSGTTGDEGVWLPVMEKAIGSLRQEMDPERYSAESATDAIAKGGSSAVILRLLTGHQTKRIALRKRAPKAPTGPDGRPVLQTAPPLAQDAEKLAALVRTEVGAAIQQKRLVTCGTGTYAQPPGISPRHAYAVLAHDPAADTLLLWNPHGNQFAPKGAPGIERGYATKAGLFTVPVAEFVQIFGSVVYETDAPAPKPPAPKQAAPKPTTAAPATQPSSSGK